MQLFQSGPVSFLLAKNWPKHDEISAGVSRCLDLSRRMARNCNNHALNPRTRRNRSDMSRSYVAGTKMYAVGAGCDGDISSRIHEYSRFREFCRSKAGNFSSQLSVLCSQLHAAASEIFQFARGEVFFP